MSKEQDAPGFKVTDKRMFRETGEDRETQPPPDPPRTERAETGEAQGTASPERPSLAGEGERIDFPSYVLSYYTQGLVLLGEVPNPYTQKTEEDADAARHTIDILALLQEKTRGNLTTEEHQLLESVLYELRLKFMSKTNRIKL